MIRFYEKRWVYFIISGMLLLGGLTMMIIKGVQLDIQFKGGAILKYDFTGELNGEDVAATAEGVLNRTVEAQILKDLGTGKQRLALNLAGEYGLDAQSQETLDETLKAQYPDAKLALSESSMVEPFFGKRFLQRGIIAIVLAGVLIVLYVWLSFRKIGGLSAGVTALAALVHDMLIVFFTFVVFGIPIGDSFIAVELTIIGYSINDTIVIYDRIRENSRKYTKIPVGDVVNLSISQSMFRSINTNLAVTISVALIYIFALGNGIESIQSFALPMAIGSVSGCYSTICIAGPLWVMWRVRTNARNAAKHHKKA